MRAAVQAVSVPRHVAIIMDGNGRWAGARGMPRTYGHQRGIEAARRTVEAAGELGIEYLTLFGFSAENWRRPMAEVQELMRLLRLYLRSHVAEMHENGVRLRMIGDRSRLDSDIVEMVDRAERLTEDNDRLHLTVALSYGGRQELVEAARRLAWDAGAGRIDPAEIDDRMVADRLFTGGLPDPDMVIRTSGEKRISNFLLWQAAYAELVFLDTLWPDFGRPDLETAIGEFRQRERRYGALAGGP
ncbi:MAG: isoprenyl transferase [Alphaproteobacteria bacterium]|jgi:undecaprenyl diphosphate synthase|nr:isoprenyl transferase [Alphaproteobacteria bacterium]